MTFLQTSRRQHLCQSLHLFWRHTANTPAATTVVFLEVWVKNSISCSALPDHLGVSIQRTRPLLLCLGPCSDWQANRIYQSLWNYLLIVEFTDHPEFQNILYLLNHRKCQWAVGLKKEASHFQLWGDLMQIARGILEPSMAATWAKNSLQMYKNRWSSQLKCRSATTFMLDGCFRTCVEGLLAQLH